MATVIGIFESMDAAETAVRSLRDRGFSESEISIIARDQGKTRKQDMEAGGEMTMDQNLADGTAWGGALGGIAGLLAGVGALAIPGVGPIIAAGPLATALSGAVTGGIAGGLIDLGIPEERGQYYEERIRSGGILAVIETTDKQTDEASAILRDNRAVNVETHE